MKLLKKTMLSMMIAVLLAALAPAAHAAEPPSLTVAYGDTDELRVQLIGRYTSGARLGESGTEIVAYDPTSQRMYSVNGAERSLDIVDLSGLGSSGGVLDLPLLKRIKLGDIHPSLQQISDITSVALHPFDRYLALAVPAEPGQEPGYAVFMDLDGQYISHVRVGALPDMLTFTPDGRLLLVANEGEPDSEYRINPEGSVSIIDVSAGPGRVTNAQVTTARFTDELIDNSIRRVNPDFTKAQDMEPEYIAVSPDSKTAYVALQENNSIAVLDLESRAFTSVHSLGYKDWSVSGNRFDASDRDGGIAIRNWPVLSMYMPDGISLVESEGKLYLLTANEGDAADYPGFSEEARVEDLKELYALNADLYAGYTQEELDRLVAEGLFDRDQLGRLKTTVSAPLKDGRYEAIYAYGGRSFSIWDVSDMSLVYDSGSDFETFTAHALPEFFNASNDSNSFDNRSDDKGPEPESVITGIIGGQTYAFVGLERIGGIIVYNITGIRNPAFVQYFSSRDFAGEEVAGDSGPEGLAFVPALQSPTGKALLLAANEVSGTIAVYELTPKRTEIQLIHINDVHSRVFEEANAGIGYAKLAAFVDKHRALNPNTLLLDAGDTLHGQTFATLVQGESIVQVLNALGLDAMAAGNHDFNYGMERLLELADMADFPILGGNVVRDGQPLLPGHAIIEVDGIRVGIFGLATPETAYKTHPNNVEGITFVDPVIEARKQVEYLKDRADVIIALSHLGTDRASVHRSDLVAEQVEGIDIIIDGHSHEVVARNVNGALIVQAGEYLQHVGVLTLSFEDGRLSGVVSELFSKDELSWLEADPQLTQLIESIKLSQDHELSQLISRTSAKLEGAREIVRTGESNLGNLITDAMLWTTGADAALTNGGGIRASIEAGDVTKGDIITVLPFGNYIVTIEATGAEIEAALQHGAGDYPEPLGAFPHVGGISYSIDPNADRGRRVHGIMIGGQPLNPAHTYTLATNDFIAAGGDAYTMFADNPITGHYEGLDEAVIAYMQTATAAYAGAEGRITVKAAAEGQEQEASGEALAADEGSETAAYIVRPGDTLWQIGRTHSVDWQELAEFNRIGNPHLIFPGQRILIPAGH